MQHKLKQNLEIEKEPVSPPPDSATVNARKLQTQQIQLAFKLTFTTLTCVCFFFIDAKWPFVFGGALRIFCGFGGQNLMP